MKKSLCKQLVWLACLLVVSLLAACGTPQGGSPGASVQPTHTVQPTPTAGTSPQATPTATPPSAMTSVGQVGKDYAFMRNSQVWVALNGGSPVQATHFTYSDWTTSVLLGQPLWSDNDQYLIFKLRVIGGVGGGGCGFLGGNYGRSGELFVLNTSTLQLTTPTVPGETPITPAAGATYPYAGNWEFLFPEDATHLLAWHAVANLPALGGLYRYDVTTGTLTLVLPAANVPGADEWSIYQPLRYANGQLFYETRTAVDKAGTYDFAIYSHSLSDPSAASKKVLEVGREPICAGDEQNPVSGPVSQPGWDVSPDGTYLVAQTIVGSDPAHLSTQIQLVNLQSGAITPIFQQASPKPFSSDVTLEWSPDSKSLVLEGSLLLDAATSSYQAVLSTTTIANPAAIQTYTTTGVNQRYGSSPIWRANSTAFALLTDDQKVYLFIVGKPASTLLLSNAVYFAWGANQ